MGCKLARSSTVEGVLSSPSFTTGEGEGGKQVAAKRGGWKVAPW